jgi:natural product precursor
MKKLKLNKEIITSLESQEMNKLKGGEDISVATFQKTQCLPCVTLTCATKCICASDFCKPLPYEQIEECANIVVA